MGGIIVTHVIFMIDNNGNKFGGEFSGGIIDLAFEKRLKNFDPRLILQFDIFKRCWKIYELAYDNSGLYNLILTCETPDGKPKPLGEWVFNKLSILRHQYEQDMRLGIDASIRKMKQESAELADKEVLKNSQDCQDHIKEDWTQWKKVIKGMDNAPESDAVAGYPKITKKEEVKNDQSHISNS